jgi:hypothetical protein
MSVAFVSAGSATDSSSTVTIPAPAGIIAGNLLVAVVFYATNGTSAMTAPSGFVSQGRSLTDISHINAGVAEVFTKTATGSEPATYAFTAPSAYTAGTVMQYSGTTGVDGAATYTSTTTLGTPWTAPSTTPGAGNTADMWLVLLGTGPTTSTTPSGFTSRVATATGTAQDVFVWEQLLASSAATGTASGTLGAANSTVTGSFLLLPGATPGSTPDSAGTVLVG